MSTNPNALFGAGGYGLGKYGSAPVVNLPLGYYLKLITSEYQGSSPNFMSWVQAVLQPLDDISQCLSGISIDFDLGSAIGAQLDTIGSIVGQPRTVSFQPSNGVSPVLDDATYRTLLMARIAQNQWDGTIDSLQSIWKQLFPGGTIVIVDGQNMSATIILSGAFTSILQDLIQNGYIVPRPEGVLYTYSFAALPIFGFDRNDAFIAGFDLGKWS